MEKKEFFIDIHCHPTMRIFHNKSKNGETNYWGENQNKYVNNFINQDEITTYLTKDITKFRIYDYVGNPNRWSINGIENFGGYHPAKLDNYNKFTNHIFNKGYQLYPPGILQLLNIKYIVLSNNNFSHDNFSYLGKKDMTYFGNNSKYDGKNVKVDLFLFNKHYPRLFYSEKVEYLNSENIFDSILTDGYDPSERVYVSEEIISLIDNDLNKSVDLLYWSPNKIEFNTRCQSDQFLVISEIFYPNDWNLIMDNNKHKIYEVNNLVRGLIVPEGDHHFIMEFDSKSFNYGFKLSYLFFYLLLILLLSTIHIFRFKKDV